MKVHVISGRHFLLPLQFMNSLLARALPVSPLALAYRLPGRFGSLSSQQVAPTAAASGSAGMAEQTGTAPSSAELWHQVTTTYDAALQSGAITKTDTDDETFMDPQLGVCFVLRVVTALRSKPKAKAAHVQRRGGRPPNPFLPPEQALLVAQLSGSHTLILNKFNVVAHHLLVVTRDFQHQTDALNAADFEATVQVLQVCGSSDSFSGVTKTLGFIKDAAATSERPRSPGNLAPSRAASIVIHFLTDSTTKSLPRIEFP